MPLRPVAPRLWAALLAILITLAAQGQEAPPIPPVPPAPLDTTPPASFFEEPAGEAASLLDESPGAISDPKLMRLESYKQPLSFFKSGRLISLQTAETVQRGVLDTRVAHRFGDAATPGTTYHTLFGLDQAADIWLGVDYGITDRLQVGIARTKGQTNKPQGGLNELWTFSGKMRLPGEAVGNLPIRLAVAVNATYSTQTANPFVSDAAPLNKLPFASRGSYFVQFLAAGAPKGRFTFQIAPAFVWRNYTPYNDANGLFFLPVSTRFKVTQRFSLTTEYAPLIASAGSQFRGTPVFWRGSGGSWFAPLNLGLELETGGHVFQISLSNSAGLVENDLLAYNPNNWANGGFRMGFAIMRGFQLRKQKG